MDQLVKDLRGLAKSLKATGKHTISHVCDMAADEIVRLQQTITTWTCTYCGEVTRDRSTAALHPALCDKWPYRRTVVRLRDALRKIEALHTEQYNDIASHLDAALGIIDETLEPEQAENQEGET